MAVKVFYAPELVTGDCDYSVFLAGTIDMGNSENWQREVTDYIENIHGDKPDYLVHIFNPRRKGWDDSWKQELENPVFNQQVNWELDKMEKADLIVFNFLEGSKSPVTMLELGYMAHSKRAMVCCPHGFYRSGNIHIVCNRLEIPLYLNIEELLNDIL